MTTSSIRDNKVLCLLAFLFMVALLLAAFIFPQTARAADARVYVDPASDGASVGSTYTVYIMVEDVQDLYGWQFSLAFNPDVLEAQSVTEGEFLKRGGKTTFFIPGTINNTAGTINAVAASRLGNVLGETGSGTLFSVTFKVISSGVSDIAIASSQLLDSATPSQSILHAAEDGIFDNTAPTVISTDPANAAPNTNIANNVKATFSDVMDPETIIADNFEIRDGSGNLVDGKVSYDAAAKTAIFNPNRVLHPKTGYTATIKTGVKDISGNSMVSEYSWDFETEEEDPDCVYVISLYMEVLQRAGDPRIADSIGFSGWVNAIKTHARTRSQVAMTFASCYEYHARITTGLYKYVLGRDPDPIGLDGWAKAMTPPNNLPDEKVKAYFYGSDEYFWYHTGSDNEEYVRSLYMDPAIIDREGDPEYEDPIGFLGWVNALNAGTLTRSQVALAFINSYEYHRTFIIELYNRVLQRTPTESEVHNWAVALTNGLPDGDVEGAFFGSLEYYQKIQ